MPKSCRKVLEVLGGCDYASQKEIAGKTELSARSVKAAVKLLLNFSLISEFSLAIDMRRKIYKRGDENGNK